MACCAKLPLSLLAGATMKSSGVNGFSTEGNEGKLLRHKGSKTTHCILTDQMQDKFHNSHEPLHQRREISGGQISITWPTVHYQISPWCRPSVNNTHTHTHTHTHLTTLCLGLPRWAGTRKEKPIWILLKQETVSGSGISWAICKSAQRSRQITTPVPDHSVFTGRMLFLPPNQQYQSTEDLQLIKCK